MTQDPRHVPLKLHSAIEFTVGLLDLPLDARQREALALELTGPVRALIAEALAQADACAPVRYAVAARDVDAEDEAATTEYADCVSRLGGDVDHDCPAAALAYRLRTSQHDVTATDVPDATTLGLTVRPQSLDCWRWWIHRLGVRVDSLRTEGDAVTATGSYQGVTINLRGDGVPELLADTSVARLMGVIGGTVR